MSLKFKALVWMRKDKACPVALFERTPRPMGGQPDVLGVTKAGYLLEIEIKNSMSDFYRNAKKPHIRRRNELEAGLVEECGPYWSLKMFPRQFWFLVPVELAGSVLNSKALPSWAGVLTSEGWGLKCVKESPVNKASAKLTPREMIRLGNNMANTIWSQASVIEEIRFSQFEITPDCMPILI